MALRVAEKEMIRAQSLKDAAKALSLANLCFIETWTKLLSDSTYWPARFAIYSPNNYRAVILNVFVLAALFWASVTLARQSGNKLAFRILQLVFPLVLLIPLNGIMQSLFPQQKQIIEMVIIVPGIVLISLFEVMPWHGVIIRTAKTVVIILFPFFLLTLFQTFSALTRFSDQPPAPRVSTRDRSAPRVLWLLFDEMDQRMTFSSRPATLQLPELDRLRNQTIYASNAYPPADFTLMSVPALINGQLISKAKPTNPSELMITFADAKEPVSWGSQPNIFSKAREAGFNTALTGYYFPYSRIIGESLNNCFWRIPETLTLRESMFDQIESLINTIPLAHYLPTHFGIINNRKTMQSRERRRFLDSYLGILEAARKVAIDPDVGLILVHLPVPHPPGIYDRHKSDFELDGESSYLDSLQLADRSLGELRRVMEDAGIWENTIVLVTSDHWWRDYLWRSLQIWSSEDENIMPGDDDNRVPFLLKLANQNQAVTYDGKFNTVLIHDLILALLREEVSGPDSVVSWLGGHRSIGESPYRFHQSD